MTEEIMSVTNQGIAIDNTVIFKTIEVKTPFDMARIANAINSPDSMNDVPVGTIMQVIDIICSRGIRKGRNGMPDVPCINTVLLLADGTSLFTQSDGIARSIGTLASLFPDCGRSQGLEYLPLIVEEKNLRSGNTLKTIRVAVESM